MRERKEKERKIKEDDELVYCEMLGFYLKTNVTLIIHCEIEFLKSALFISLK